jgi:type I restriction enzyme S subunit
MKEVLPPSEIGKIVSSIKTWNPSRSNQTGPFLYIDLSSVDQKEKRIVVTSKILPKEAPSRARQLVLEGDVLVSTVRPNLNGVAYVPGELDGATASTGFCVLRPKQEKLVGRYLYHWVQSPQFVGEMVKFATGANYPAVSDRIIKKSHIPLPPLAEQRRIAAILDKTNAIRRKRQQAIKLADDFLRATFFNMFGDPVTNPKGWAIKKIEEISTRVTKGESPKWQGFNYQETGVSFVTSENVLWGSLDKNKRKYIPEKFHKKLKRSQLKENDLLVNLVGASVGRTCLVTLEVLPANINQAVSVTTLDTQQVYPQFVLQQILTPQVQKRLVGNAVDFARANISLTNIRELEIMLPPINEQKKWMALISKINSMVSSQNNSIDNCKALFNSLTQRAFRGEL